MAFGKKSSEPAAADVAEEDPAELERAVDEAPPTDEPESAVLAEAASEPAPAVEAAAAPSTDALLSMFQESKDEVDDLAVLTDLAGETDIDDILEELRTLRAALGITDAFEFEDEALAA
jgi:hypothetical protein